MKRLNLLEPYLVKGARELASIILEDGKPAKELGREWNKKNRASRATKENSGIEEK